MKSTTLPYNILSIALPIAPLAINTKPNDEYFGNLKEENINQKLTKKAKAVNPYLPISPES